MTQEAFIVELFVRVDEQLATVPKDPRAKLYPSELVNIGVLFSLKGQWQLRFYQWLCSSFCSLFPCLPERTRQFRLLNRHQALADHFLDEQTLPNYGDSFGIALIYPRRKGRSKRQIGKKGISNSQWFLGIKFSALLNGLGRFVDWDAETANVHDSDVQRLYGRWVDDAANVTNGGFHRSVRRGGDCRNLVICEGGQRNYRMIIETVFS